MKQWAAYLRILVTGLALQCSGLPALANWDLAPATTGTVVHIFNVDSANQGTSLCAVTSVECGASVPINTAGAPLFVTGTPGLVTGTGGTFPATQSGTWNITNVTGTVSLPTGAATSALQTTGNTALTTINTTLGTPMQASGGSLTANAGTNLNTSLLALEGGGNLATLAGAITAAVQQTNEKQINGVVPLMGNGVTGTGSQRVTVASDNTAFSVNAVESGTWNITNISGTVSLPTGAATSANQTNATQKSQIVDGSGNVIASTSNNLNVQCANCSGSGVSAADAATFTAGTSLFAPVGGQFTSGGATACVTGHECTAGMTAARAIFGDMSSIAGTATSTGNGTSGAGVQRVAIASDNTAFAVNATLQATATTAIGKVDPNTIGTWGLVVATQNSATPTNGHLIEGQFNTSPTTITSGNVSPLQLDNAGNLLVNIKAGAGSGGTALADNGAFTQGTTNMTPIGCFFTNGSYSAITTLHAGVVSCTSAGSVHTTVDNTNANGQATMANSSPVVLSSNQSSVPVVNGGNLYKAVAASQTATTLGATGATGDYLSHCVIYPTSTSPGVVTVFDSTNTAANSAVLFAGGATSTSNLTPIAVPVGAKSINGAWKATTGANVSVVCYGTFT